MFEKGGQQVLWWKLRQLTSRDWETSRAAWDWLSTAKPRRAIKPLIKLLTHPASQKRTRAAQTLGMIGDPRAIEPLVAVWQDSERKVRVEAARALRSLHWQPANDTERLRWALDLHDWNMLASIGELAIEPLVELLKDPKQRRGALFTLVKIGDPRTVGVLVTALHDWTLAGEMMEAIQRILEQHAAEVDERALTRIAELTVVRGAMRVHFYDSFGRRIGDVWPASRLDCTPIRELARQEVQRRGLPLPPLYPDAPWC